MKIAKIEQFRPKQRTRLVKITTDEGLVGWGETTLEGKPKSTWQAPGDEGVHYQHDAKGRVLTATFYPDTSGIPLIKHDFAYAGDRLQKEEVFKPRSAEDPAPVLTRRTSYRAAVAGFPAGFNAEGLQYFSNATLSGLERRFDLP